MEGEPQKIEKKKKSSLTEAALLSVGLLAAHPEAKALDMPPYTPWHIGVQDNLRDAVKKDKVEYAVVYAQFTDLSGAWVSLTKGEDGLVTNNFINDMAGIHKEKRGKEIAAVCHIHTHQAEFLKKTLGDKAPPYVPPSPEDITFSYAFSYYHKAYGGMDPKKARFAVADSKGLWYFGPSGEAGKIDTESANQSRSLSPEQRRAFFSELYPIVLKKSFEPGFDMIRELPAIQQTYLKHTSAKVRFVSYEKITEEPPCAGVYYKPSQATKKK